MRMLRDRFLEPVGEVPPTTEPTAEVPIDTGPTIEVPATDPPLTDEVVTVVVTRTDDSAAEGVTEVTPVVADQVEGDQVATETAEVVHVAVDLVEVAQEQSVETPFNGLVISKVFEYKPFGAFKSISRSYGLYNR
ncbi:hypothetical protein PIB30_035653 [Stylosanthes scabra]|uniref:Uncharacterized protein n=1 Tax=Stylosanthes scabra TaxID=79078 RepID=A0ABU6RD96_9FABA|nr:hypothetical protein [Stylosanthes scabra]